MREQIHVTWNDINYDDRDKFKELTTVCNEIDTSSLMDLVKFQVESHEISVSRITLENPKLSSMDAYVGNDDFATRCDAKTFLPVEKRDDDEREFSRTDPIT